VTAGAGAAEEAVLAPAGLVDFFPLPFFLWVAVEAVEAVVAVDAVMAEEAVDAGEGFGVGAWANATPSERIATATRAERVFFISSSNPLLLWPVRGQPTDAPSQPLCQPAR
jgi:hypothetical protein